MKVREFFRSRKSFEIIFIVAVIASFFCMVVRYIYRGRRWKAVFDIFPEMQ